jgi:hypothetical protein
MSDYKMTLHLWPGAIGHIAAELESPDGRRRVIGFGPAGEKDVASKEVALPTKRFYGDGDGVRPGDAVDVLRNDGSTLPSSPIPLSKEQFDRLNDYANRKAGDPGMYRAPDKNCVRYLLDGMDQAGVQVDDLPKVFSPDQLRRAGKTADVLIDWAGKTPADWPADPDGRIDDYKARQVKYKGNVSSQPPGHPIPTAPPSILWPPPAPQPEKLQAPRQPLPSPQVPEGEIFGGLDRREGADLWQQPERIKAKAELVALAKKPEPPPPGVFTTVPWSKDDEDRNGPFPILFHQGGAVPADGDPRTEVREAIVQEGEFVLAPVTAQAVDPDLVAAMNAMAAASPDKARKLRDALAAILGDGPALSEEALKKRLASERDYWRSGPEGDAKRWWYATEYRFAFSDDQDGRTDRADGGLVTDGDRARRRDDLPAELPEGGFVLSRQAVRAFGANLLGRLNAAGLVENASALTEVRRAIARAMQMDPRSWRDLDRRYIDRIADEYRFAHGD